MTISRRSLFAVIASLPIWARLGWAKPAPVRDLVPEVLTPTDILEEVLPTINSALDILLSMYERFEYPVAIPQWGTWRDHQRGVNLELLETQWPVQYRMETYWAIDEIKLAKIQEKADHLLQDGIYSSPEQTALMIAGR